MKTTIGIWMCAMALAVAGGCDGSGVDQDPGAVTEAPASCGSGCADGERCFEGRCVVELCDDVSPCSDGGACLDGACCYSPEECDLCDSEDCY